MTLILAACAGSVEYALTGDLAGAVIAAVAVTGFALGLAAVARAEKGG